MLMVAEREAHSHELLPGMWLMLLELNDTIRGLAQQHEIGLDTTFLQG